MWVTALILVRATCLAMASPSSQVEVTEDSSYYETDEYPYWNGPGWYWGVYINNENEYWNHYDQHYPNRPNPSQRREGRGERSGGGHGGGGRH